MDIGIQVQTQNQSIHYNLLFLMKMCKKSDTSECKESRLFSILYSKPLQEFGKTMFEIGDKIRISEQNSHFSHRLRRKFLILLQVFTEKPSHTQQRTNRTKLSVVNLKLIKVI